MERKVGKQRADELYNAWVQGISVKDLIDEFDISRQRIYQILNDYKNIGGRDKMLRAVNKFSK